MNNLELISIISPIYKAENTIDALVSEIQSAVAPMKHAYEIILVEDGGCDKSWDIIQRYGRLDKRVKGIKLSRNFGQHQAVTAGIQYASGAWLIILDCDLQDDPKHIVDLLEKAKEGFDIVFTKRGNRQHSEFKKITAALFNLVLGLISDKRYDIDYGSMVLLSKKVQQQYLRINDNERLYLQLLKWLGFNQTSIPVIHRPRLRGKSTYTVSMLVRLAIAGWTSNSDRLLRFSIYIGLMFSSTSIFGAIYIIWQYFNSGFQSGWASIFVLLLLSTGLVLSSIGVLGIYIGKTFKQSKANPLFIVEEEINLN